QFIRLTQAERIDRDLGWNAERIRADLPGYVGAVHDYLHELAQTAQPMGLHTFGRGTDETWRIATVLMMLGKPFWEGVAGPDEEADEALVDDYKRLPESTAFRRLQTILQDEAAIAELPESLRPLAVKARGWYRDLGA